MNTTNSANFWDDHYGGAHRIWSGQPNPQLVREASTLTPGTALDLACGEGADAIWLAQNGWAVTAVDVSQVALDRAAEDAAKAELPVPISFEQHDLQTDFPVGQWDFVTLQFFHSPIDFDRGSVLRRAAAAVALGGTLLIVGHAAGPEHGNASGGDTDHHDVVLPQPEDELTTLALDPDEWTVQLARVESRQGTGVHADHGIMQDTVVKVRRR